MCIDCWGGRYELQPIRDFRDIPMQFCHRCGERTQVSYGVPVCLACDDRFAQLAA